MWSPSENDAGVGAFSCCFKSGVGSLKALLKLKAGFWTNAFNRLKDFRRIATRYDKLARNYLASVCLAAALVWWI